MAYVSLYRKYRPQTFSEIVGQEHVSRTLSQAVTEDRLHHAYLFTGPRGTGKTSTARILAKAINCEQGPTATPCNACSQCLGITTGSSVDVIEIDAASHGGVDDVRDLRDRVAFAPASARMKVYIVDECHMLSTAGWNAFLKTVEEPPGHVLFVFATTEPHKVLATILSRTQRFDFKRVPADLLAGHVRDLCGREGVTIDPDAVELVVRAGDGSVRDTLSVLDQVMAFTGSSVTAAAVADVLGVTPAELLGEAADALAAHDAAGVMTLVQRIAEAGLDARQFARDLVEHLRSLFLLQVAPDAGLVETTPERLVELRAQSERLGRHELLRAMDLLADAQALMRRGNTRLPLELALAKAAMPEHSGDAAALAARLDRLERSGAAAAPAPPGRVQVGPDNAQSAPISGPELGTTEEADTSTAEEPSRVQAEHDSAQDAPIQGGADLGAVLARWDEVMDHVKARKIRFHAMLQMGRPLALNGNVLTLEFRDGYSLHADQCASPQGAEVIAAAVQDVLGFSPAIRTVVGGADAGPAPAVHAADEAEHEAQQMAEVMETEDAERHGELPDDAEAEALAVQALTTHLGATVVEDAD
ncbi:MAG TPA: DNA polymerase III subunit gamma/tau [Egibacteraceae bacterium]|nr:DNA polymerase III subunit gamma/tau [Egibacteraceae bacterium]